MRTKIQNEFKVKFNDKDRNKGVDIHASVSYTHLIKQFFHQGNQTIVEWYFKSKMNNGNVEEFDGISLIVWTQDNKIKSLKEFGCNLHNYNPYRDRPVARHFVHTTVIYHLGKSFIKGYAHLVTLVQTERRRFYLTAVDIPMKTRWTCLPLSMKSSMGI